jgi:hypothetical protein
MKNLEKLLLVTASTIAISVSAIASDSKVSSAKMPVVSNLEVKLTGFTHFQAGHIIQSKLKGSEKNVSQNRRTFAFYNDAALLLEISNKVNDITYGGKIVLIPTTKTKGSPSCDGSHIFLESDFGKIELGSPISSASNMMINGGTIAAATFDDWGRYAEFSPAHLMKDGSKATPTFFTFTELFLDSKLTTSLDTRSYSSEPARNISFYTPKFKFSDSTKAQVGITYTPDSSNTGTDNLGINSSGVGKRTIEIATTPISSVVNRFDIDKTVKDAFSAGATLEQSFTDGVDFKLAVTGEYSKAAGKAKQFTNKDDTTPVNEFKLSNLRTYNIGAILTVGNFSYGGSFSSLGKSLTTPKFHKTGRKTDHYTGTVAYKQGPFAASISYFKSNQFKNTIDAVSIGTHYLLAPGFKPYAEISGFSLKGRPEFHPEASKKKTRGTAALIGAKLSL